MRLDMRMIAAIDVSTGASGDKMVGALLEICEGLGVMTREDFCRKFESMLPDAKVTVEDSEDHGIHGLHLFVHKHPEDAQPDPHHEGENQDGAHHELHEDAHHEHHVDAGHEHHDGTYHDHHGDDHLHDGGHHHEHRTWAQIRQMIESWRDTGAITQGAANRALKAFHMVAQAEAQVHGKSVDEVHFHEVGAIDSIVDTVGASILIDALKLDKIYCTPITVGFGTVDCAHGTLPVPAPATQLLLEGFPVQTGPYEGEMTTPTGAALLHANVTNWTSMYSMVPRAMGFGLGTRHIDGAANALRIVMGTEISPVTSGETKLSTTSKPDGTQQEFAIEQCVLLQTNIDHLSPEMAASCCEDILKLGAKDVWQSPITMKKGRLGFMLNVLTSPECCDSMCLDISRITGSLGIRRQVVERTVAPRAYETLKTKYGDVGFKVMEPTPAAERSAWVRPEHSDVERIARETNRRYRDVFDELVKIWQ